MTARDVLAKSIWDNDCVISGDKRWTWDEWRERDPENAAFYFTVAGVYLADLEAAGFVVSTP